MLKIYPCDHCTKRRYHMDEESNLPWCFALFGKQKKMNKKKTQITVLAIVSNAQRSGDTPLGVKRPTFTY